MPNPDSGTGTIPLADALSLLGLIPDGLLVLDTERRCRFVNHAFEIIVGRTRCELLGRTIWEILDACRGGDLAAQLSGAVMDARSTVIEWTDPDGFRAHVYVIPLADGGLALLLRDVSVLEAHIVQTQKLEAVGQLAKRVAHDFGNVLLALLANADMLLDEPGNRLVVRASALEMRDAALRGLALTRQLQLSSRRDALRPRRVGLNAIVSWEEPMLRRLLGPRAHLSVALSTDAGTIHADPDQFGQILLNLVVNARDAMPDGGVITIETGAVIVRAADAVEHDGLAPGSYATLTVRDTGVGMDEATKARIFEPFFTTKGPGHGTGLGLPIVMDVVRDAGGAIGVSSAPAEGTAFHVYWPRADPS